MRRLTLVLISLLGAAVISAGCEGEGTTEIIEVPDCSGITDIGRLARCVTQNCSTRTERIAAAFLWVRDSFPYDLTYYECKPPGRTLSDGVGDCCDKAKLLAALLHALDEPSYYLDITCEPMCGHTMLALEASEEEADELSRLTGGGSFWKRAHCGGMRLAIMDVTSPGVGYIGHLDDMYYVWTSDTTWEWTYYTTLFPTWEDPDVIYARAPARGVSCGGDGAGVTR